ncbi:uncharacterized protein LOC107621041 [Arachis ipaensis]|uniref:uncharacterized protein LOC107621041 n=1 Tax=Arachis ipaensis TaxID=130454 RepID=UPI0007AFB258|nr:uncharacterized protein LOC107621041 [Arachis ipaensis]
MAENREAWKLAVESGAIPCSDEEDIMVILQEQNEELARKRRQSKQKEKIRRSRPKIRKQNRYVGADRNKKKDMVNKFDVTSIWGNNSASWECVNSFGASGGLLLIWDVSVFEMLNCYKKDRWLCVEGVMTKDNFHYAVCLVYGPHVREEKLLLWKELSYVTGLCQIPFCYIGDFNEIVHMDEKNRATGLSATVEDFRAWINDMELVDLTLNDRKYTWFRGQSCSRIDRCLVSLEWLDAYLDTRLRGRPRGLSDHCPLIVEDRRIVQDKRPFRSLDSWFTHEGFLRMLKEEWRGLGDAQFLDKLKALSKSLGRWHK